MTIDGALSDLNNLLKADDIPCYYKPSIKAVMDTIALEQEPRKGYLSIDDVMSVFEDFMCGEVDEDGTETFLEMLKDKGESGNNK